MHCLRRLKQSSGTEIHLYFKILTFDPLIHTIMNLWCTVQNQMEQHARTQNNPFVLFCFVLLSAYLTEGRTDPSRSNWTPWGPITSRGGSVPVL